MKRLEKIKWSVVVATLAALVVIWTALDPWPAFGWETPIQHDADFLVISGEIKEFRDEWKCDEDQGELYDLLKSQRNGDNSVETEERIQKLRRRMNEEHNNCDRFEDVE